MQKMTDLKQLEQAAEKCAADLLNLKNAIEALKAKEAALAWPMSVDDLPGIADFFLNTYGPQCGNMVKDAENIFATIEAANSAAAFSKLSRLVHNINGREVYEGGRVWFKVGFQYGTLHRHHNTDVFELPACLYFKSEVDRDRSMIDHRDLWVQYFTGKKA